MNFTKTTLQNGLRVITVPMPGVETATVQVFVGAGSRHETLETNGLAHFLEHMVFKGTKRYPSAKYISSAVDGVGGETNAYTGKERTAFFIRVMEKHLALAFDILSGFIKDPLLKVQDVEKEKGVILEEIAMYEDLPMRRAPEIFEELLYPNVSLGWDIAGKRENIKQMKQDHFIAYRQKYYYPENLVLVVAGKFSQKSVLELARKCFGDIKKTKERKNAASYQIPVNPSGKPEVKLVSKKTEQAHLVLGVRGYPLGHEDRFKETILSSILGGGMSSRVFTQVRERRGLAYYVSSYVEHFVDNGYLAVRAGIRLGKEKEAIKVVLEEFAKVAGNTKGKITKKEVNKAKEYTKGKLALALEDTEEVTEFFGAQELMENKIMTPQEVMKEIDKVQLSNVEDVAAEFFQDSRLNFALVGPYNDPEQFQKILKL